MDILTEFDLQTGQIFIEFPAGVEVSVVKSTVYAMGVTLKHSHHELTRKVGETMLKQLKCMEYNRDDAAITEYIDPLKLNRDVV
jgi:hypothetical protein